MDIEKLDKLIKDFINFLNFLIKIIFVVALIFWIFNNREEFFQNKKENSGNVNSIINIR